MRLIRMTASFGCLNHATLELKEGVNVLFAPNEGGKSTWCAFIRAMLYGFNTRARDKKGEPAEKNRYKPWSGQAMEGRMELLHEGRQITLYRGSETGTPMGDFVAVYTDTGQTVLGMTGENCGEMLTGVGREVFDRSIYIRQESMDIDASRELEQRISALVTAGDEGISWSQAEGQLKQWLRERNLSKNGQLLALQEEASHTQERLGQISKLHQEEIYLQEEADDLSGALRLITASDNQHNREEQLATEDRWARAAAELDSAQLHLQALENRDEEMNEDAVGELEAEITQIEQDIKIRGRSILIFSLFGLVLSGFLVAATFMPEIGMDISVPSLIAALCLLGGVVILGSLLRGRWDRRDLRYIDELQDELDELQGILELRDLEWESALARERSARQVFDVFNRERPAERMAYSVRSTKAIEVEGRLIGKKQQLALLTGRIQAMGDYLALEAQLEANRNVQSQLQSEYDAISIALDALTEAERELRVRFSPELNTSTSKYFSRLTGGRYEKVSLDRDFSARTEEAGSLALRDAAYFSQGTRDQLYLAVRLAISELLLPAGQPGPALLDDVLLAFDDARGQLAMELLGEVSKARQVLLFTCHERDMKLAANDPTISRQALTTSAI